MTKFPPNRCLIYTESDKYNKKIFDNAETMIKYNAFWDKLKKLYIELTDLHMRIENLPKLNQSAEIPSGFKTKYLKYKTKYINLKNNML